MKTLLVTCLLLLLSATSTAAALFLINPDGTGDFPAIQQAIDVCVDGDIIELTDGTYTGAGNRDIDFLGKAITLRSQSLDAARCVIDCEGSHADPHRGFWFHQQEGSDTVVECITITGGFATESGGAVYAFGGSPLFRGCTFRGNFAVERGGGMSARAASPVLIECSFVDNQTYRWGSGGGLWCGQGGRSVLTDCVFVDNAARWGGGLSVMQARIVLSACEFNGNAGVAGGGGMRIDFAEASMDKCRFVDNAVEGWGGAVLCERTTMDVRGCSFIGNGAEFGGGAWLNESGVLTMSQCSFDDNTSNGPGGAIFLDARSTATMASATFVSNASPSATIFLADAASSTVILDNSIVAFSDAGSAVASGDQPTLKLSCCDIYGNAGGDWLGTIAGQLGSNGNISEDPLFCGSRRAEYALDATSPCAPENSGDCGQIGAFSVACGALAVDSTTWGAVKAAFR